MSTPCPYANISEQVSSIVQLVIIKQHKPRKQSHKSCTQSHKSRTQSHKPRTQSHKSRTQSHKPRTQSHKPRRQLTRGYIFAVFFVRVTPNNSGI